MDRYNQLQLDTDNFLSMILLVDDQIMVGEAIRRALKSETDLDFHYCGDPNEAIAIAREVRPTVILQDLVMPGIDGIDLVRSYRADAATRNIPIIVLSTKEEPAVKSAAFAAGANDYLVKLPDKIELIARLRYHSRAYLMQLQRDEAYKALRESQRQLLETNIELKRLTDIDGLTGLSNRRYLDEFLTAEWRRAARSQTAMALLMIDVDHFKEYNDIYGHLAGDAALREVAEIMRRICARSTDIAARFGGEEFAIVLPTVGPAGAYHLAEKLRGAIADLALPHSGSAVAPHLTVSIGAAAALPQREGSPLQLIDLADRALYEAKRAGRNRCVLNDATEGKGGGR